MAQDFRVQGFGARVFYSQGVPIGSIVVPFCGSH